MQSDRDKRKQLPPEVEKIDKRKQRYKLRRRFVNHMTSLTAMIGEIRRVSSSPERDFALIFKDESVYFKMLGTLHIAHMATLESKMKLLTKENKDAIQISCSILGLRRPSDKQLSDRHIRARILRSIERKESKAGTQYLDLFRKQFVREKRNKVYGEHVVEERKKIVTCSNCNLEQKPVENFVICDRCGWQGSVIGNLYVGFRSPID